MPIYKNVAGQKVPVYAWDDTTAAGTDPSKTGDAANITAEISKDGGASAAANDANPTELDAADHPGVYLFDLTQAETNADVIVITPVSTTSNILLDPIVIYTTPGDSAALDANIKEVSDDAAAADKLELACDNYDANTGLAGARLDAAITSRSSHDAAAVVTALGTGSTLTACLTATGFSTHTAAQVWLSATRTLTESVDVLSFSGDAATAIGMLPADTRDSVWQATFDEYATLPGSAGAILASSLAMVHSLVTVTDQTHFVLTNGSSDDDAYKDRVVVFLDQTNEHQRSVRKCTAYVGATKTMTIDSAPDFTIVNNDRVSVLTEAPGGAVSGSVTVGDIEAAALAKFATTDTGEAVAVAGSVAKLAQGAAGGNVTVEAFTNDALLDLIQDDTGARAAVAGSVAQLSRALAGTVIVVSQPVAADGQLDDPLIIGDDYAATNARDLNWTVPAVTGATAAASTCKLGFKDNDSSEAFTVDGTVSDNGDGTWKLSFDIAASDTQGVITENEFEWSVELTDDSGNELTLVHNDGDNSKASWIEKQT